MYSTPINGSHSVQTGGSVLNKSSLNEVGKQVSDPEVSSSEVANPVAKEQKTIPSHEDCDELSPVEYFKIVVEENTKDSKLEWSNTVRSMSFKEIC